MMTLRPILLVLTVLAVLAGSLLLTALLWPSQATAVRVSDGRCTPSRPCLAIVIDDVGRDVPALERLLAIPAELTFSVLPHAESTAASLRLLRDAGREYLLHVPMAPQDRDQVTDEPLVITSATPAGPVLAEYLERVPGAVALNNHMGSAMSTDAVALQPLLRAVADRGLAFLDSRTTAQSRICAVARTVALPCLQRDVFLDDPGDTGTIGDRLREAAGKAASRGWAIAIGHPLDTTIEALQTYFAAGPSSSPVEVVRLSRVFEAR